jgi:RhtB (resistance to homoserine/threonine) family protein
MVIALLGAISPGPDFAIVTRNCLSGKFRVGVLTSLGIASALVIHLSYCILGIALLISQSSFLYYTLKYAGAAYLLYLGILMLKDKTSPEGSEENLKPFLKSKKRYPPFVSGFLCNLLNPKATLFILSIFTQYISPDTSLGVKVALGSLFPIISFLWFTALSYMLTHHLLQKHFQGFQVIITKIMGVFLCLLAICVAFT